MTYENYAEPAFREQKDFPKPDGKRHWNIRDNAQKFKSQQNHPYQS